VTTYGVVDALYIRNGDVFEPTELTRGPWDPDAQHGGAPAALIAGELERVSDGRPFARIALHLLKPVPLTPLTLETEIDRDGRRARRLRADLKAGGETVCFAYALQLQGDPEPVPEVPLAGCIELGPDKGVSERVTDYTMFGGDAVDVRFVNGGFGQPGPATAWFRLMVSVVDGDPPSPLQRTLAAADFGNGISSAVRWDEFTFVNPELTVFLLREPDGEWIGNDAVTAIDPGGIGLADATLHDAHGPFGRALQSLYVARRR
jgi:acyl-Coa thioesterase superfamily protein/acyl-CoA thioesterase superfamily protein